MKSYEDDHNHRLILLPERLKMRLNRSMSELAKDVFKVFKNENYKSCQSCLVSNIDGKNIDFDGILS